MKKLLILILCVITLIPACASRKTSEGTYPSALMWNDKIYFISGSQVNNEDISKEIGKIERKHSPMPEKNGDSNDLKAGSKIYEVNGKNIDEFIVVERQDGFYSAEPHKKLF